MFYVLLIPLASLCPPSSVPLLIEGELTELTRVLLPLFLLAHLPPSPPKVFQRKQNLMEFTTRLLPGLHCWLLPHCAASTHTHTLTQSLSSGRWYGGETHKFTCHPTLATLQTTARTAEES